MRDDDPAAYRQTSADKGAKTKPSKYTKKFKQMYGELKKRDPKGIYRKFSLGKINNVAGLDLKIQKPTNSDLHITDCKTINTDTIISHVINRFSTS